MSIFRYPPVGRCIYRGTERYSESSTKKLATEHIIPLSLYGSHELPEASCRKCERITGRTEQVALRGLYRALRRRLDYPHRKKQEQPEQLPVFVPMLGKADRRVMIPISEYPHIHFFIELPPPARLLGAPAGAIYGREERWLRALARGEPTTREKLTSFATPALDLFSFCRMLAKIGHAFAVAELGLGKFTPFLLDVILNESKDIFHYVGGVRDSLASPSLNTPYTISVDYGTTADTTFVVVHLRLFATVQGSPIYQIVVGETAKRSPPQSSDPLAKSPQRI